MPPKRKMKKDAELVPEPKSETKPEAKSSPTSDKKSKSPQRSPRKKTVKFYLLLRNIDIEAIERKYGLPSEPVPANATSLSELAESSKQSHLMSYIDESKTEHLCKTSMINFSTGTPLTSGLMPFNCYWCRHPFSSYPIGCPIRYVSNRVTKSYFSEISRENRVIRGNATPKERENLQKESSQKLGFVFRPEKDPISVATPRYNISVDKGEYYETDGIFCSFNCCKAYLKENKTNKLYTHSGSLLIKLYRDLTGSKSMDIDAAPHWRQLREYGGTLSIEAFRSSFNRVKYECHGIMKHDSIFRPVATLYEERINF